MYVIEHQEIEAKAWDYYRFNVTEKDYQIIANIAGEDSGDEECELQTGVGPPFVATLHFVSSWAALTAELSPSTAEA